jgi:hypothetical protein
MADDMGERTAKRATTLAVLLVLVASACGSPRSATAPTPEAGLPVEGGPMTDGAGADAGAQDASDTDAGFREAPHAPLPVVPNNGGPILAAPKLVTIVYAGFAESATMSAFGDWIVGSSWLMTVGHDYGVGPGSHVTHVVLPGPAPAQVSDLDVQALLQSKLGDGTLPSAAGADAGGDAGYLYMIFYPPSTQTGSFLDGPSTCTQQSATSFIGGYHWETESGAYHVPYAVIPTCSSGSLVEGASDLEASASHELIEAATDPFPDSAIAYGLTDLTDPWVYTAGEVADLCEGLTTQEAGFTAQRVWSNSAAAAGASPCVPASSEPFYDVSPSPSQTQVVAAGGHVTFTLTGFSTTAAAPWALTLFPGPSSFTPTTTLGASMINNGQTTTLTVTVPAGTPSNGYAAIFVTSSRSAADFTYWPVAVTVP